MATRGKSLRKPASLDPEEEELLDEEPDEEDMSDEDRQKDWDEFCEVTFIDAVDEGWIDKHLKRLAYVLRERYRELHPEEFVGDGKPRLRPVAAGDYVDPEKLPVLGAVDPLGNSEQLKAVALNVGLSGKIPTGSFRANHNAYRKDQFIGRFVNIQKNVKYSDEVIIGAGSLVQVVDTRMKTFSIIVQTVGFSSEGVKVGDKFGMRYDYNKHLFANELGG